MITEYTDCAELLRLITEQKIKPTTVKRLLRKMGIVLTSTNAETIARNTYTIMLGGKQIEELTQMIVSEGNYEKSVLLNAVYKNPSAEDNALVYLSDRIATLQPTRPNGCSIEKPVKQGDTLSFYFTYKRNLPGKNRLIQEETRQVRINMHLRDNAQVAIDIRQPSTADMKKTKELLQTIVGFGSDADITLSHINLENLAEKRRVDFFDQISSYRFPRWNLKTITGITVKRSDYDDEEEEKEQEVDDALEEKETSSTLAGISQAVLNGNGLRSNEFVQSSISQGYYISSMKYRYNHNEVPGEFIVCINSKGGDLRVDIEKSYYDENGQLSIQPFPKEDQDVIIQAFQNAANNIYAQLLKKPIADSGMQ